MDNEHPAIRAKFVAYIFMKNWNKNTFSYVYKGYNDEFYVILTVHRR